MFSNCTNMTTGPSSLPAETVASDCYASMFARCINLGNAPELPAMNLADRCYFNMFWLCGKLNSAPALPATILAPSCYEQMFYGCSALTSAPDLPATASVNNCYRRMFYGCSLSSIKCYLLETNASDCVSDWFDGAPSSGTFWKNSLNTTWPTGASGIPTGWTVMDITP